MPKKFEKIFAKTQQICEYKSAQATQENSQKTSKSENSKNSLHTTMERHIGISQGTEKNQSAKPARSQERLNTQIYINLEQAIFEVNEDYHVKVAETLDEACKLLEVGFEYVTDIEGKKLFRKRK